MEIIVLIKIIFHNMKQYIDNCDDLSNYWQGLIKTSLPTYIRSFDDQY